MSFYNDLLDKVKDIDIGLVVLNAGVCNSGLYLKTESEKMQEMIDTNCYQVGALVSKFLPIL